LPLIIGSATRGGKQDDCPKDTGNGEPKMFEKCE